VPAATRTELGEMVRDILAELFPDDDVSEIGERDDLTVKLPFDSMAEIDVVLEIERRTNIHVPDEEIPNLTSIGAAVDYLESALAT
jgi:acyl carrier protein